jgi:hypothetical protein
MDIATVAQRLRSEKDRAVKSTADHFLSGAGTPCRTRLRTPRGASFRIPEFCSRELSRGASDRARESRILFVANR